MPQSSTPAKADTPAAGTIIQPSLFERFIAKLEAQASIDSTEFDTKEITAQVAEKMMSAASVEEMLAAQDSGMPSGKSMVDTEMEFIDYDTVKSDPRYSDHSLGYYFRVYANRIDTGEKVTFGCGAPNIMVALDQLRQRDQLNGFLGVIRSRPTPNGELLTLRSIPKRAIAG